MQGKQVLVAVLLLALLFGAVVGLSIAQERDAEGSAASQTPMGTHFTYQDVNLDPPLSCILLVDDDGDSEPGFPDVRAYYTAALDALDLDYDIWDVATLGDPYLGNLVGYGTVLWFTGFYLVVPLQQRQ